MEGSSKTTQSQNGLGWKGPPRSQHHEITARLEGTLQHKGMNALDQECLLALHRGHRLPMLCALPHIPLLATAGLCCAQRGAHATSHHAHSLKTSRNVRLPIWKPTNTIQHNRSSPFWGIKQRDLTHSLPTTTHHNHAPHCGVTGTELRVQFTPAQGFPRPQEHPTNTTSPIPKGPRRQSRPDTSPKEPTRQ